MGGSARRTILLVQEFGTNYGHITRLVALALALGPHRFVFAVPDVALATPPVRQALGPDVLIVAGWRFRTPGGRRRAGPECTLADVFHAIGYDDGAALLQAAQAWWALIDEVRPDLIVADFAPTVRLASWDRIPVVAVTGAFSTPPADALLPVMQPRGGTLSPENIRREDRLLAAAQSVRAQLGGPLLRYFGDLFQGERVFAATVPVLDPYEGTRAVPSVSPFPVPAISCGPVFAHRTGPHIFCYLWSDHAAINPVLTALNGIARPSQVHIRGANPAAVAAHCAPQVGIRTEPADFGRLLPQTRLFIHYGGAGACYAGLLAGVMQLVLPVYLEQEISVAGLVGAGGTVGLALGPQADPIALRGLIERQLDDATMQGAALAAAEAHHRSQKPDPRQEIAAACLALMNARR